jgi:WD40 repeat protein
LLLLLLLLFLYGMILEMTVESDDDDDDWEYKKFRWIVGSIIALKEPLTIGDLSGLLDLWETPDLDPVDTIHFITILRTVLVAGTENINNNTIPRLHKSFVEYITSTRADAQFRIDVPVVDGQIATKCLRLVGRLKNAGDRSLFPAGSVRYAIHNLTRHLLGAGVSESGVVVGGDVEGLWKILLSTAGSRKGFMSASGDYRTHMYDPKIGLPLRATVVVTPRQYRHSSIISGSNPIWGIAVSSDSRLIASADESGAVQIWDSKSHNRIGYAGAHSTVVWCVCFSPDSRWLVSGGGDKTVRLWHCDTRGALNYRFLGHTADVNSVCTDRHKIISGSSDGTIRIWSLDTRQPIGAPIRVRKRVLAVALSDDGRIVAGVGHDVCLFDIETREQMASMKGHTSDVWTVAFSPDGSRIASGSQDNSVCIWDAQTGKEMHRLNGHTNAVRSVAFSPDGLWIASGSIDRTVGVWNSETGQPVGVPLIGHTHFVTGVSFSPDSLQVISGSNDRTIHIWSALGKWEKPPQQITAIHHSRNPALSPEDRISLQGHPSVISACCSPDGSLYAASTLEGQVSIWNTERTLLWETNLSVHPIHFLHLSETQLILSAPDGSTSTWNLLNGKPTHEEAVSRGPQLNASSLQQSTNLSNDKLSWFPFDFDAGLWAYVDSCLIRFEREEGSITIFDVQDFNG